jgi:hypothetical protein
MYFQKRLATAQKYRNMSFIAHPEEKFLKWVRKPLLE